MIKKIFSKFFKFFGYYFASGFLKTHNKFIREELTFNLIKEYSLEQQKKSYEHFKPYFSNTLIFETVEEIRKHSILESNKHNNFEKNNIEFLKLEFGIFKGVSTNFISQFILNEKLYAFDSFKGLSEDWIGFSKAAGSFSNNGIVPDLNSNVEVIQGDIYETLEIFLKKKISKISFIHLDLDTYPVTKFVLEKTKPYLTPGCVILFDELHNFFGWENGAYKALNEIYRTDEYDFLSFTKFEQAAIQIK
jgi:hypothetical protein